MKLMILLKFESEIFIVPDCGRIRDFFNVTFQLEGKLFSPEFILSQYGPQTIWGFAFCTVKKERL